LYLQLYLVSIKCIVLYFVLTTTDSSHFLVGSLFIRLLPGSYEST